MRRSIMFHPHSTPSGSAWSLEIHIVTYTRAVATLAQGNSFRNCPENDRVPRPRSGGQSRLPAGTCRWRWWVWVSGSPKAFAALAHLVKERLSWTLLS